MKTKILLLLAVGSLLLTNGFAQTNRPSRDVPMYNTISATSLLLTDTVTNTGTAVVRTRAMKGDANTTTIQAVALEISGTTAGTITLQGSLDGVNFKAIPTIDTQTSVTTATATDVGTPQVFTWRLNGSPYLWYQVSWTGTGTMVATLAARLMSH